VCSVMINGVVLIDFLGIWEQVGLSMGMREYSVLIHSSSEGAIPYGEGWDGESH